MDKPWDCLRKAEKKPPMEPGEWSFGGKSTVRWEGHTYCGDGQCNCVMVFVNDLKIGNVRLKPDECCTLGEFLVELGTQLKGKE